MRVRTKFSLDLPAMQTSPYTELVNERKSVMFLVLCLSAFALLLIKKNFLEAEIAAFQILEERGEMGLFHALNAFQYLTIPLVYLVKITVGGFVLWLGCFMFGYRITFSQIWGITLLAEFVFVLPEIIKIVWFFFFVPELDYYEIRAFYPLSLMHFTEYADLDPRYHYPFKTLNVFEILFWIALALGIHQVARKRLSISFAIVATSYVPMLLLWLWFYMVVYK
jgi:hypothetical protein